jgi:hypothetical protein
MSIYMLDLPGWEGLSTWGWDDGLGCFYAQLTRNGNSDDNGPDVWITRGRYPLTITELTVLAPAIALATGVDVEQVEAAMNSGLAAAGRAPAFPAPPDTAPPRQSSG